MEATRTSPSERTNWEAYYTRPRSRIAAFTQHFTLRELKRCIRQYFDRPAAVMELGGGGSCFAESLCALPGGRVKSYSIIDNCELAVRQFAAKRLAGESYLLNAAREEEVAAITWKYDFVYSVGLVEHFRGEEVDRLLRAHFSLCREDGLVVVSVPTPTRQYRMVRRAMEQLGKWSFPDEAPLRPEVLLPLVERYGTVLESKINYYLPLTQLIVAARPKGKRT